MNDNNKLGLFVLDAKKVLFFFRFGECRTGKFCNLFDGCNLINQGYLFIWMSRI